MYYELVLVVRRKHCELRMNKFFVQRYLNDVRVAQRKIVFVLGQYTFRSTSPHHPFSYGFSSALEEVLNGGGELPEEGDCGLRACTSLPDVCDDNSPVSKEESEVF